MKAREGAWVGLGGVGFLTIYTGLLGFPTWNQPELPLDFQSTGSSIGGSGLLKRNSFYNHLKHVAFSSKIWGNHH